MDNTLKKRAIIGVFWSFAERFLLQSLQFITGIILARILGPKEFGIVAMVTIFIQISQVFIDSGFGKSLIQKKEIKRIDIDSVFCLGLFIAIFFSSLLIFFSKNIANFYNEPILIKILPVMSISLIFMSLRQVQQSLLSKDLLFKKQFKANIIGKIFSAITGITLAFMGYGVWALVIQQLIGNFIITIIFWFSVSWKPRFQFSFSSIKELFVFGSNLLLTSLIRATVDNGYGLVIGKVFSVMELGLYNRGRNLMLLVVNNIVMTIQKTTFPMFSKLNDDFEKLKRAVLKSLDLIFFFISPLFILLILLAKPLVLFLLSEKWIGSVVYFQFFCVIGFFQSFSGVNMHLLLALGKSKDALKIIAIRYTIQLIFLTFTYKHGILFIIYGQLLCSILDVFFNTYYSKKYLDIGLIKQILAIKNSFIISVFVGIIIYIINANFLISNDFLQFAFLMILGLSLYMIINYIFKIETFFYIKDNFMKVLDGKLKNG